MKKNTEYIANVLNNRLAQINAENTAKAEKQPEPKTEDNVIGEDLFNAGRK